LASFWFVVSVRRKTKRKKRAEKKKKKKKRGTWVVDARKWARAPVTPLLLQPQRVRAALLRAANEHKRRRTLEERER